MALPRIAAIGVGMLLIAAPTTGAAQRSVYLNGTNIDGAISRTFEGAQVRIDSLGNVHITAPSYSVKPMPLPKRPVKPAPAVPESVDLTQRYWLVSHQSRTNATNYDVDVFANGMFVTKVKAGSWATIFDLTEWLRPGSNTLHCKARENENVAAASNSPADFFKLMVGFGIRKGSQVVIEKTLVEYQRTAAETGDHNDEYTFVAQ